MPVEAWPPGRPRILVTDAWLANAGDAAIAVALDDLLRELAPDAAVLHASYHHERIGPRLPALSFVPPLEDLVGVSAASPEGWGRRGPGLVDAADLVVCQGGGFLVEGYQPTARLVALADVVGRGRPLALVGLTVDRFVRAVNRAPLQVVLRGAEMVIVRDPASIHHAAECGATDVVLGTDLTMGMFLSPPPAGPREGVAVVVTDHHPSAHGRVEQKAAARHVLAEVRRRTGDEPVTLWSTVQGEPDLAREDDSVIAAELVAELPDDLRCGIHHQSAFVGPIAALDLVRSSRAIVTMRMHPAIFAAGTDTPFGLVLGGQRTGVFHDTTLIDRIAAPGDAAGATRVIERALGAPAADSPWEALGPLRLRYADMRDRLAELVAAL
jgi:polysaccharide pyruvyl transferase WcaK-like protein